MKAVIWASLNVACLCQCSGCKFFIFMLPVLLQESLPCAQDSYNIYVDTCHAGTWQVPASGCMATQTEHEIFGS